MKRIIWHWTAGAPGMIGVEADSYHEIVQPNGTVQPGTWPIEANRSPIKAGRYAAHTRNCNSDSIGIACDAMAGAQERPLVWGANPLTEAQIAAMLARTAHWCRVYGIRVGRRTTLSHAEVQRTLDIRQSSKWDFTVLPGMTAVADPLVIGDKLRAQLAAIIDGLPPADGTPELEPAVPDTDRIRITTFGSCLNLRRWPSFNDNIIGQIPGGTVVTVQRRGIFGGTPWICVNHDGREGWVVASYTRPA